MNRAFVHGQNDDDDEDVDVENSPIFRSGQLNDTSAFKKEFLVM